MTISYTYLTETYGAKRSRETSGQSRTQFTKASTGRADSNASPTLNIGLGVTGPSGAGNAE